MSEPLLRALARVRAHLLDDEALGASRRVGSAAGHRAAVAPRRAEVRRPQVRPAPPGHDVRRGPGPHAQPRGRRRGSRRGGRPARPALRQLARRHHHRDPSAPGHQEARGGRAQPRAAGRARPGPRPRQGPAAPRARPGLPGARAQRPRGADEAEPAVEVPPGGGVPPHPGRVDRRRSAQRSPADADSRGAVADRRPGLRQRLSHVRHREVPDPRPRAPGPSDRGRPPGPVTASQRGDRPRSSASTRRSSPARSARSCSPSVPTWCSRCTPATPPRTTPWRGRSSGRHRWCSRPRAAITTSPPSSAGPRRPRRTPC